MRLKNVLFVVNHSAQLKAPYKLISFLNDDKEYQPIVYFNFSGGWSLLKEIEIVKRDSVPFLLDFVGKKLVKDLKVEELSPEVISSPYIHNQNVLAKKTSFFRLLLEKILRPVLFFRYNLNQVKYFKKILKENKIDYLIVPEDNYDLHYLIVKAANDLKIPTVLIPFTLSNHLEVTQTGKSYVNNSFLFKLVCWFNPQWKFVNNEGNYLTTYSSIEFFILKLLGLSPINPFLLMGGRSKYMLVENEFTKKYFVESGIRESKMIKTGGVYQDTFQNIFENYEVEKKRFYARNKIEDKRPVILCNLFPIGTPPNEKYAGFDYKTIGEAAEFWLKPLIESCAYQVWVNHHPRTNVEYTKHIESWDLKVIKEPIEEILPFCDVYVSGISATIRMALTCAKPTICFNDGFVFTDYKDFKGVITADTKQEYLRAIANINDPAFFKQIQQSVVLESKDFGPLDGNSYNRIINFLKSI